MRPATTPTKAVKPDVTIIHSQKRRPTVTSCLTSPILHIPLVILKKTSGTMSIFSIRRKTSPSGERNSAAAGEAKPIAKPITIPMTIFVPRDNFFTQNTFL